MEVILIRHTSVDVPPGVCYGQTDVPLKPTFEQVAATGGESFAMQYRRVSDFLDELKGKPYQRVAIFAHGGVLICAQIYAGIIKPEEAFSALTPYGGIVRITL